MSARTRKPGLDLAATAAAEGVSPATIRGRAHAAWKRYAQGLPAKPSKSQYARERALHEVFRTYNSQYGQLARARAKGKAATTPKVEATAKPAAPKAEATKAPAPVVERDAKGNLGVTMKVSGGATLGEAMRSLEPGINALAKAAWAEHPNNPANRKPPVKGDRGMSPADPEAKATEAAAPPPADALAEALDVYRQLAALSPEAQATLATLVAKLPLGSNGKVGGA